VAGTAAADGDRPRQLVEAASSGNLAETLHAVPPGARQAVAHAAREGFLSGLNEVLFIGGVVAFAGAALALWLIRESDIEREPEPAGKVSRERVPETAAA
jgi:hypothetical protein